MLRFWIWDRRNTSFWACLKMGWLFEKTSVVAKTFLFFHFVHKYFILFLFFNYRRCHPFSDEPAFVSSPQQPTHLKQSAHSNQIPGRGGGCTRHLEVFNVMMYNFYHLLMAPWRKWPGTVGSSPNLRRFIFLSVFSKLQVSFVFFCFFWLIEFWLSWD